MGMRVLAENVTITQPLSHLSLQQPRQRFEHSAGQQLILSHQARFVAFTRDEAIIWNVHGGRIILRTRYAQSGAFPSDDRFLVLVHRVRDRV